jgi:transcriptional regulator with XRE-family HTH domain
MQIGERIAAYRKRRGMSQDALAGLVGMSRSWLSQVERGIHTVDRLSTLTDLAAVLRVDVADLVGREWRLAPNGGSHVQAINAIGGQLADYSYLVGERRPPWPLPQLRNATVEIHRAYQAAHYDRAAVALPKVLAAADAYDGYGGRNGREVYLTRSMVYAVAAKLLTKVGEGHLAWLAADRATHAAMTADSVTAQGVAAYQVVCALLEDEQIDQAERAAVSFAERLTAQAASDAPDTVSLAGALWLIAGVIAARKSDRSTAINRLDTAEQLTGLIGHDGNHAWTASGQPMSVSTAPLVSPNSATPMRCSAWPPRSMSMHCPRD